MSTVRKSFIVFSVLLGFIIALCTGCGEKIKPGTIIYNEVRVTSEGNTSDDPHGKYLSQKGALLAVNPSAGNNKAVPLTSDFYSALSPVLSYDGSTLYFAGRINENSHWQIWALNLKSLDKKALTSDETNAVDPVYLPGNRIAFTMLTPDDSLKAESALFIINEDGTGLSRLTFNPHSWTNSSILADGRLVSLSTRIYPDKGKQQLIVLRPDGTKAELFYEPSAHAAIISRPVETGEGDIFIVEANNTERLTGELISIKYKRPLHSRNNVSAELTGEFRSVANYIPGKILVTYRENSSDKFALYEFDTKIQKLGAKLISSNENIAEAVVFTGMPRPRKLPSEVDLGVKTGLLMCQNINITGLSSPELIADKNLADRIEIIGLDSSLGIVETPTDGSFYLKIMADKPFRIVTYDKSGKILNGPGSWLWIRPNERRGCVGCHEDPEITPANRYAAAVGKAPVAIPVHVTRVKEKEVELE